MGCNNKISRQINHDERRKSTQLSFWFLRSEVKVKERCIGCFLLCFRAECTTVTLSVRQQFTLSPSTSPEPLDEFWWAVICKDEVQDSWSLANVVSRPDSPGVDLGREKLVTDGSLLCKTSLDPNLKASATNGRQSYDLEAYGKKSLELLVHSEVKFWRLFGLGCMYFRTCSCIFYWFLCSSVSNLYNLCVNV